LRKLLKNEIWFLVISLPPLLYPHLTKWAARVASPVHKALALYDLVPE